MMFPGLEVEESLSTSVQNVIQKVKSASQVGGVMHEIVIVSQKVVVHESDVPVVKHTV